MKTQQEIEQLAKEEYKDNLHNPFFTAAPMGYVKGYTQCQEDMVDKKYTEADLIWTIQEAYGHGQDDEFDGVNKVEESIRVILEYLNKHKQNENTDTTTN